MSPTNEQIKLFANYLNAIATGTIVAGIVGPAAALVLRPGSNTFAILYLTLTLFVVSIIIHVFAQLAIRRLTP